MYFEIELLRAMIKALPDPVFVITESGHYLEIAGGKDPAYYHDGFGHSAGDKVLCRLTKDCAKQLRQADSLYRIGGEEFAVLLPETNAENACQQAERLRQVSEQLRIDLRQSAGQISISVGVSEFADADTSIEDVMKRADARLYEAKRNGRNRVVGG
ncbi:MAG: GGDEF domain-containing protein [Desulfosalsimonas sp.]|uniref:GGDEF domain-containing protein n=1 Tax=Desulfosalsimonas sp. TaxID=3073848 RepID=UPI003970F16A